MRVGRLFETIRHPRTGKPYTNAEVARMSVGALTEDEVEGIRTGAIPDPAVGQVAALAGVFGVATSYLVDRKGPPVLDAETLAALADETAAAILRESALLPDRGRSELSSASSGSPRDGPSDLVARSTGTPDLSRTDPISP